MTPVLSLEVREGSRVLGSLLDVDDRAGDRGGGRVVGRWPDCPFGKLTEQTVAWTLHAPGIVYEAAWLNAIEPGRRGAAPTVEIRYRKKGAVKA